MSRRSVVNFDKTKIAQYACSRISPYIESIQSGLILVTGLQGTGKTAVLEKLKACYGYFNDYMVEYRHCRAITNIMDITKLLNKLNNIKGNVKRMLLLDDVQNLRELRLLHFDDYANVIVVATADELTGSALELNGNTVVVAYDLSILSYNLFKEVYKGEVTVDKYIENAGSICCGLDNTEYLAKGLDIFLYNERNLKTHEYAFIRDAVNLVNSEFDYMFTKLISDIEIAGHRKYTAIKRRYLCASEMHSNECFMLHKIFKEVSLYIDIGEPVMLFGSQICRMLSKSFNADTTKDYVILTDVINAQIYERIYRLLVLFELYRRYGTKAAYEQTEYYDVTINNMYAYKILARNESEKIEVKSAVYVCTVIYGGETTKYKGVQYINYNDFFKQSETGMER